MVTRLLLLVLLSYTNVVYAQSGNTYIKLAVDSDSIYFGDTVVLDVESTGLLDPLDLSPLTRHATLERETTGTRIAVVKGKVVEIAIRRMDLTPKRAGVLILGPIMAGPIESNSVHVNILNATRPTWKPEPDDLSIDITTSPDNPYVGQQVILDITLKHRYPINSEKISLPDLHEFSTRVQREQIRTTDNNGFIERWRYFIFPKSSGDLTLTPIVWQGNITRSHTQRADFKLSSAPHTLQVKPAPDRQWWLPSERVVMSESWSQPATSLRAGDELERTIKVIAAGNLSGQIPTPTPPESRAIIQTPLTVKREETISINTVVATAEFTFRMRAQSPIPVFLDTVRLPWWNTELDQYAEAIIPARRINVGLPDRADLLAELALLDSGTSRFKNWLQSSSRVRLLIYSLAALCSVYLIARVSFTATNTLCSAIRHRQIRRELLALENDPQQLYIRLEQLTKTGTLPQECLPLKSLRQELQSFLFSHETQPLQQSQINTLVKQVSRHIRPIHRRSSKMHRAANMLAEL